MVLLVVVFIQIIAAVAVYMELTRWLFFYSSLPFLYLWNANEAFFKSLSDRKIKTKDINCVF